MIEKLQALDIKKQYNSNFALECSIEVKKGPLYTIVGPNGSGKSTLLRILGLIEPPDSGEVIYHNEGISLLNPDKDIEIRRKAVLVATRAGLFNETVYENIAYGLRLRKVGKKEIKERVTDTLNNVKLAGKEAFNANELSSGEAQRLALARALAIDPDILLLDEPTASLDPDNTRVIEDIINNIRSNSDKIIIMVTHSLYQAKNLSEFIIFMHRGKAVEFSNAETFFKKPSTELAQKFVFGEVY
jgi:tungstate transport system ATP-binding protein